MFQSFTEFLKTHEGDTVEAETPNAESETPAAENDSVEEPIDFSAALEETINQWLSDKNTDETDAADSSDGSELEDTDLLEEDDDTDASDTEEETDVSNAEDDTQLSDEEIDRLWQQIVSEFGIDTEKQTDTEAVSKKEREADAKTTEDADEIRALKEAIRSLSEWQTAVQQYLQTSVEAENIRQVAQQLAALGVILPDEQIQEIARVSQQLNIPPSVLLKAKAYDYTIQQMQQRNELPYPFMNSPRPTAPNVLPNAVPYQPHAPETTKRTGFTGFREFLKQMGISE